MTRHEHFGRARQSAATSGHVHIDQCVVSVGDDFPIKPWNFRARVGACILLDESLHSVVTQWAFDGRFLRCVFQDSFQLSQQGEAGTGGNEVLDYAGILAAWTVQFVGVVLVFRHRIIDSDGQRISLRSP
ncbi:hypothetical protein D3C84_695390 [compost metagenome]